jgi:hypothetical protein
MKIPLRHRVTRKARFKIGAEVSVYWHTRFAWLPVILPEERYETIIVPRHVLWLEKYERRGDAAFGHKWRSRWDYGANYPRLYERRTYRGAPTLRQLVEAKGALS